MDGSTLSTVESATLTQGVAFLYAQAGELLRRRREKRDRDAALREQRVAGQQAAALAEPPRTELNSLPPLDLPDRIFKAEGSGPATATWEKLDRFAGSLLQARRDVDDYVVGMAELGGDTLAGLQAANRLRCMLEEIYGAAVTFRGEQREADRTATYIHARDAGVVANSIHAKYVAGHDINIEHSPDLP